MGEPFQKPRRFKTPLALWKAFLEYKGWAQENKWYKNEAVKSGQYAGSIIRVPHERALTEWEFASFCGMSYQGLRNYGEHEGYEQYFDIYGRIKTEMAAQRISGGLVGAFTPNLVARIDGIAEKQDIDANLHNDGDELDLAELTDSEKEQLSKLLDKAGKQG